MQERGGWDVHVKCEGHGSSCAKGQLGDREVLHNWSGCRKRADCDDGNAIGHRLRGVLRAGDRGLCCGLQF
jgi:hypothetical protein